MTHDHGGMALRRPRPFRAATRDPQSLTRAPGKSAATAYLRRAMIDHLDAPAQSAGSAHHRLRIRRGPANQKMRRRREELHECPGAQ